MLNFKGFGTPKKDSRQEQLKEAQDFLGGNLRGYDWLKSKTSDDKVASQQLAQFVMRCVEIVKGRQPNFVANLSNQKKADEFRMMLARMLTYTYYTQMSIALAEFEPSGVEGMTIPKTIAALCDTTDEQLHQLDEMLA